MISTASCLLWLAMRREPHKAREDYFLAFFFAAFFGAAFFFAAFLATGSSSLQSQTVRSFCRRNRANKLWQKRTTPSMFPRLVNPDKPTASPQALPWRASRHKVVDSHPTTVRTYTLSCGHSKHFRKFCKQIFAYCPRKTQFAPSLRTCAARRD